MALKRTPLKRGKPLAPIGKTQKKCEICHKRFIKSRPRQPVCDNIKCALEYVKRKQVAARVAPMMKRSPPSKAKREAMKTDRPHQVALTQAVVNKYVVYVQEAGKPCYTCGFVFGENTKGKGGNIDCGHWLTRGAHPEKARDVRHLRRQCKSCNRHNGGRPDVFEAKLIAELGQDVVDDIRRSSPPKQTCADLIETRKYYSKLIRDAGID